MVTPTSPQAPDNERDKHLRQEMQQLTYAVSHDLREPVRMVQAYMQLLERQYAEQLDDKAKRFIHYASDGAQRMGQMLDELLALSRANTRELESEELVDLQKLLPLLKNKFKGLNWAGTVPSVVAGDEDALALVFDAVLARASQQQNEGKPPLEIEATTEREMCTLCVTGTPVPKEARERFFDVFPPHVPDAPRPVSLAASKRLVERMGGAMWLDERGAICVALQLTPA